MNDRNPPGATELRLSAPPAEETRRVQVDTAASPALAAALASLDTRRGVLRRSVLGIAGFGLVGLAAGCGSSDAEDGDEVGAETPTTGVTEVAVRDNEFDPATIEVPVGAPVTWRWEGRHDHNVHADTFESAVQREGTFTHTFAEPGRYEYRCTLHGGMDGEVVVVDSTGAGA